MVPIETLKRLESCRRLSDDILKILSDNMEEKKVGPGDVIIREGEISGALYLIAEGTVTVVKKSHQAENETRSVARLEAGEFFGEMSLLENKPHSASVISETSVVLYLLPRERWNRLTEQNAPFTLAQMTALNSRLSSRLRRTTRDLISVFEVARLLGQPLDLETLIQKIMIQLSSDFGEKVTLLFYRWNPFNDEYTRINAAGPYKDAFPPVLEGRLESVSPAHWSFLSVPDTSGGIPYLDPISLPPGHLVISRSEMRETPQGLFIYYADAPGFFETGERQLMEIISIVLGPALETVRAREEEAALHQLEQRRQQRYLI